jgi:recombinational DNA repair ATPase RecF
MFPAPNVSDAEAVNDDRAVTMCMSGLDGQTLQLQIDGISVRPVHNPGQTTKRMLAIEFAASDGSFTVNLPASEAAMLMFEIGYALEQAHCLTLVAGTLRTQ